LRLVGSIVGGIVASVVASVVVGAVASVVDLGPNTGVAACRVHHPRSSVIR
jgi:hypothetical protein